MRSLSVPCVRLVVSITTVGPLAQRREHPPVGLDRFAHRTGLREWMAPPRLAEAAHEQIVSGIEKEHLASYASARRRVDRALRIAQMRVAADVERDRDVADARSARARRPRSRGRREEGVRCSKSPSLRMTSSPDSSPHRRGPLQRRSAANSYEALFARTRQRPHSEARAAHRGALEQAPRARDQTAGIRSGAAPRRADPAPRLAGVRSPLPPPRFGELKHEIGRLIYRIESLGCVVKDIDLGLVDFPSMLARRTGLSLLEARGASGGPLARHRRGL